MERSDRSTVQVVWGIALVIMGLLVFYRIPQVMPKIENIQQFSSVLGFIRFCFYLLGVLLVGGGTQKLYRLFRRSGDGEPEKP